MLEKYSMRITTRIGEVKTQTFREPVHYGTFEERLRDFVCNHIAHSFIFDDFSTTTLEVRYDGDTYKCTFNTLDSMKEWYINNLI